MPHFQFPTNYVYWEKLKDHDDLKSKILPIINKLKKQTSGNPFELCKMTTSYNDDNKFLMDEDIKRIVWNPIEYMINEIKEKHNFRIEPIKSILDLYWFNSYEKGDFQEMHNHMAYGGKEINGMTYYPSFCLIYILNDDGSENKTSFIDYTNGNVPFSIPGHQVYNTAYNNDINEGSVIIFSPHLMHGVGPIEKSGRITIAFNVYSTFKKR